MGKLAVVCALACCPTSNIRAQAAVVGSFNSNLSLVQAAAPDSMVQILADEEGLSLVSPGQAPRSGTFWWIMPNGTAVPAPCAPSDLTAPIYQLAAGQFLVDQTGGQIPAIPRRFGMQAPATSGTAVSGLETEADTVMDLILQAQTTAANQQVGMRSRAMDMNSGPPGLGDTGDGGDGTNNFYSDSFNFTPDYGTNLWLGISSVANGVATLTLSNTVYTQTGEVYEVMSKPDLASPGWNIATEVWAVPDENWIGFTMPMSSPTNLFFWARDWTGVTSGGNQTPEWWFWKYFGTVDLSDTHQDADGNSLLFDYTNDIVPNVFSFSGVQVADNYVSATPSPVQLDVTGYPYYVAVLVDDPNFNDAVWNPYSSPTMAVNLWPQGWHDVWIGVRGHADAASAAVWQWQRLKLDYTPPTLIITNPTATVVDKPVIQLQGFANEALEAIAYDISNATGIATNQLALVIGQDYSTNTAEFTTNYFQAYDVPLTNGLNVITLHATDLAGNVTTTNFSFTLDYSAKTNPPAVQWLWPLDGMEICGSNIVCRGQLSDDTATVTVQLVDANGMTNTVGALVGRDGVFYAGNLNLAAGTNHLSYTVTDAAGNVATTSITVSTSDLGLTLDPVVAGQALVTGTIDDDSYTVYVNGVQASVANGAWSAMITPIGVSGGAVVVNAVKNGGDPSLQQIVQPPQGVFISMYRDDWVETNGDDIHGATETNIYTINWRDGQGGNGSQVGWAGWIDEDFNWLSTSWPQALPGEP